MKLVSILSSCYNEQDAIEFLAERVRLYFAGFPQYRYEHIIMDNQSNDRTVEILRSMAKKNPSIRVFVNKPNSRTPLSAIAEASTDAAVILFWDLHDLPEAIGTFLSQLEASTFQPIIGTAGRLPSREITLVHGAG